MVAGEPSKEGQAMDTTVNSTLVVSQQAQPISSRQVAAEAVKQFEGLDSPWTSCSQIARRLDVPDSTLRHWLRTPARRMPDSQWPGQTVRFLESPEGLSVLHRIITAAHLVFVQANDCGIRHLCAFLELCGLDEFFACSYCQPRETSVAVDETFHPDICLVGIEPVSDFIVLEDYQPQRDGDTWNRCLGAKLAPLPTTVCQVVSDEAKAIIHYAEVHLGAHHSPDLFHVQQDTSQAVSLPVATQSRHAEEHLSKTQAKVADLQQQFQACREECPEGARGWNNNFSRPRSKRRRLPSISRRARIASSVPAKPDAG